MSDELSPIESEQLIQVRDIVYERIKGAILEGRLKPGERLVERRLGEQLKVSRTPIREAVRILEQEGLVSHVPRVGAVVARVNDAEVHEIYRIRAVLEGLAARMAAERIKPGQLDRLALLMESFEGLTAGGDIERLEGAHREFNDLLYVSADSPRLYGMITSLVDNITRYVRVGYGYRGRISEATREHRQLVEAIRMRDGDLAERVAREHIDNSRRAYLSEIASKIEDNPAGRPNKADK